MISVVIPSIGRPTLLPLVRALDRAAAAATHRFEVIIVQPPEHRSTTFSKLRGQAHMALDLRFVVSAGRGVNRARNAGAELARAEWIWFLDDDVDIADARPLAAAAVFADPRVLAVGGDYRSPAGVGWTERAYNLLCSVWRASAGTETSEQLLGGTMLVRRSAWQMVGGFDAAIEYGGSETGFVERLHAQESARVVFSEALTVLHRPGRRGLRGWARVAIKQAPQESGPRPELGRRLRQGLRRLSQAPLRDRLAFFFFAPLFYALSQAVRRTA